MVGLSIIMVTARKNPGYQIMLDSLHNSWKWTEKRYKVEIPIQFIAVDEALWKQSESNLQASNPRFLIKHIPPKPTVWRGPFKLTKKDYWDKQSALNTGICYAIYDHVILFDDNTAFSDSFIYWHYLASKNKYAAAGSYKYYHPGVVIEGGKLISGVPHNGQDNRLALYPGPSRCSGGEMYGGNLSAPLEAILACNGWDEILSGSGGLEDSEFGVRLSRVCQTFFFPDCVAYQLTETHDIVGDYIGKAVADIQGLTNSEIPQRCKGFDFIDSNSLKHWYTWNHVPIWLLTGHRPVKQSDGSWKPVFDPALASHRTRLTTVGNGFNLRKLRQIILNGGTFPAATFPIVDWRDHQKLRDM